ncbi:MAG: hypothetical protein JW779_10365 [Candidatus Thorarchaeota archaeon]|nr:hypothetical protein [Candidatus Thorarchaeota archaeon]
MTIRIDYSPLREQIETLAKKYSPKGTKADQFLLSMVNDVERAMAETLEIFPVCHHSPSSALHLLRRLSEKPVKAIYVEMCEDLRELVDMLPECELPVALQAFAGASDAFPEEWFPLTVVAPLTESSAEYQAIAYAISNPDVDLVFVDRAVDYIFQNIDQKGMELKTLIPDANEKGESAALGIRVGDMMPTMESFLAFLLKNARVRHFSEWWDQYVDQALLSADYQNYRQILFLIGSLFRKIGTEPKELDESRMRERFMWTRIKQHMKQTGIKPSDAIYICGASHSVCEVSEFGTDSDVLWDIPPRTATNWLYGLIPYSFSAIEKQFDMFPGMISISERTWKKGLASQQLSPLAVGKSRGRKSDEQKAARRPARTTKSSKQPSDDSISIDDMLSYLIKPPSQIKADDEELVRNCVEIVSLARSNGYLASTADSIAIYETSLLLANLRERIQPSFFDFQDAAVTCLEKDYVPKNKNIFQLCHEMLSIDKMGRVGYTSLPPLAQDVYDRLSVLQGVNLKAKTNQRALMDFKKNLKYLDCSDVLWQIHYLLPSIDIVVPIMGELELGKERLQESWDIKFGKQQAALIQLGYEGISLEQVIEQRMNRICFRDGAKSGEVLQIAKDSILLLRSPRFTESLGSHAEHQLATELGVEDAPDNYRIIRELIYYYQATSKGVPDWIKSYVATGYSHYISMLPQAFVDRGTTPEQIAGMLNFILTLENLAISMGCNRTQLVIALQNIGVPSHEIDPNKLGLLWSAEWLLRMRTLEDIRSHFELLFTNPLLMNNIPQYVRGFLLSLTFAPGISSFIVEILSRIYSSVPTKALLPWLLNQLLELRVNRGVVLELLRDVILIHPTSLKELDNWSPPWEKESMSTVDTQTQSLSKESSALEKERSSVSEAFTTYAPSIKALLKACGVMVQDDSHTT